MQIIPLTSEVQLSEILAGRDHQAILKHNTTCSISQGVLERLQKATASIDGLEGIYLLDLQSNRELSNLITSRFGIPHQSPQLLLFSRGRCVYHEWGFDISADALAAAVNNAG